MNFALPPFVIFVKYLNCCSEKWFLKLNIIRPYRSLRESPEDNLSYVSLHELQFETLTLSLKLFVANHKSYQS